MSTVKYEIEQKSDFLTGTHLVVRIPDDDVDENALLTIQEECPDFLLPFSYKSTNGQTEFTYRVGTLCKLQYFYGGMLPLQYINLWTGLLKPLLECRDWFMNPYSFVLSADSLYFDKIKNVATYVYVPSKSGFSGADALSDMVVEVARNIKVENPVLENKVLRAIIGTFNPTEFLNMLTEHRPVDEPSALPGRVLPAIEDATQETKAIALTPGLRCVGRAKFPQFIEVDISDEQIFTIGRYDANVGKQQSSFEFEARTKAISRRHAVIERKASSYTIVDLSSSAGTFVNDKKIPPNTPTQLENGCRVSFGNMGADYVWETN